MSSICMGMKNDIHIKGWAATLVLKQRHGGTRKWPIPNCYKGDYLASNQIVATDCGLFYVHFRLGNTLPRHNRQLTTTAFSKTVLDSGFLVNGTWIPNSNLKQDSRFIDLNSQDSGFHEQEFAAFRNPDYLTLGDLRFIPCSLF